MNPHTNDKSKEKDEILTECFFVWDGKESPEKYQSWIHDAMEKYSEKKSREDAIGFVEYEHMFRKEESLWFHKECERIGGMFSLADYGVENIYNDFKNKKPIKCHWDLDGRESQWEYDENNKLIHKIIFKQKSKQQS